MIIWVLVLISKTATINTVNIWVNTFDSKVKCEQKIKKMEQL